MKQFLEDVLAKMNAGENEEAKEMIEAKIAELENPDQTAQTQSDPPLPGQGNNGTPPDKNQ